MSKKRLWQTWKVGELVEVHVAGKSGMSNKDVAGALGRSIGSIEQARTNLDKALAGKRYNGSRAFFYAAREIEESIESANGEIASSDGSLADNAEADRVSRERKNPEDALDDYLDGVKSALKNHISAIAESKAQDVVDHKIAKLVERLA